MFVEYLLINVHSQFSLPEGTQYVRDSPASRACIMHRAAEAHHSELSRCSPKTVELPLPDQKMLAKASAGAKTVHQLYKYHLESRSIRSYVEL